MTPESYSDILHPFHQLSETEPSVKDDSYKGLQELYGMLSDEEMEEYSFRAAFPGLADDYCEPYPCLLPQQDAGMYRPTGREQEAWNKLHRLLNHNNGWTAKTIRLVQQQRQYHYFLSWQVSLIKPEEHLKITMDNIGSIIRNRSQVQRQIEQETLYCKITELQQGLETAAEGLDPVYVRFLEAELNILIQHRRELINAQ